MPSRVTDRLSAARRRQFVGRGGERNTFQTALVADELPWQVLFVFGPGGIGKTTLLGEFAAFSEEHDCRTTYLDGRAIKAEPEAFLAALRSAMNIPASDSPFQTFAKYPGHSVLLIDTYEDLCALDEWMRDEFLPELPESVLVVIADRNPPSSAWLADPGWQTLIRTIPLRNLAPEESRAFLSKRNIPTEQHQSVLDFTHGHPLALSLVADLFAQRSNFHFRPETSPDVVKTLLERLVDKVPGPAHRAALEVCALVRLTTETLLAESLAMPDAHELFGWLRGLSFIESGPHGLVPHDLARETLVADLRWRNPDWYAELHHRVRDYYSKRVQQTQGMEQERVLTDYIFLHRDNPIVRPFFDLLTGQTGTGSSTDAMRDGEIEDLIEMIAKHEGDESARIAAGWFARQPQGVMVYRDAEGKPAGLLSKVSLERATKEEIASDPATQATWSYLEKNAPLRSGERATIFRYWMARDSYQGVSATQSLIFVNMVQHYLTTPGLAFTFLPCANPAFWSPVLNYADLARLKDADYQIGKQSYGVYGHDWRTVPPINWLNLLAGREIATTQTSQPPSVAEALVVLSQPEFVDAVRAALRDLHNVDSLRANPLCKSRIVFERAGVGAGANERIAALKETLKSAMASLQNTPRDSKLYRALHHTYVEPSPSQEQAAELLDLPFSTFRRHLKAGITRVTEIMWQEEIGK